MALIICSRCGEQTPDWKKVCDRCGEAITIRGRQQQESVRLADRIAATTKDAGYATWQRTVITDVVNGGGPAGWVLVFSTVAVCTLAFIGFRAVSGRLLRVAGVEHDPGAMLYIAVVIPITVVYFKLAAPFCYRLHLRWNRN